MRRIDGWVLVGSLAVGCGPGVEVNDDGSSGGSAALDDGPSSGTSAASSSSTSSGGSLDDSPDDDTNTDPECLWPGDICEAYSVCQCTSGPEIPDSCACEAAECTEDAHCDPGWVCVRGAMFTSYIHYGCRPAECVDTPGSVSLSDTDEPGMYATLKCVVELAVIATNLVEISGLDALRYVLGALQIIENPALVELDGLAGLRWVGEVTISGNAELVSIAGLADLESIGGGEIIDNPKLPTADIETLLARIPGGDEVLVCGNLDGEPCGSD